MPNTTSLVNNFLVPENARADRYDQHVFKVDQVINANHRFFARYARNKRTEVNDYAGFPPEASPWYQHGRMNVGFAVEGTSVLSPSLVLSSRAGFIRHDFYIATHGDNFDPSTLGFPSSFTSQLERQTFPQIQWDGYSTFGSTFGGNNGSIFTVSDTWSWSEVLSKTSGNHSFKFGGELRALVNNQQNPTSSTGRFTFNRAFTQRNALAGSVDAGSSVASLLLGYPADGSTTTVPSVSPIFPQLHYGGKYFGLFVQDDWRINSRLTLNAGLRWDYESPVVEDLNQQNIGFDMNSPSTFQVPGLSLTGGLLFASDDQRMPFKKDLNNIQPRAGATFRIDDQTVLRGGYALAYLPTFDNGYNNGFSVTTTLVASTDGGITPTGRLSNPFPAGLDQPVGNSQGLSTLVGRGFTFSDPERTIPYVHQFSVGVQRELPGRLALDMSYVGSRTRGLPVSKGINEITAEQLATGAFMLQQVPNPYQGLLPGTPFNGATVPRQQLVRPYSQFASINEDRRPFGVNDYDALQISVNKRMSSGLQFLVSYTYSRTEEEVTYLNPQDDFGSADARRHRRRLAASPARQQHLRAAVLQGPGGRDGEPVRWLADERHRHVPVRAAGGDDGGRVPRRRSDDREPDARALVQHLHAGAERRAPELRVGGRADRLAGPAPVHAAHADDASRGRADGASRAHRLLAVQDVLAAAAHADTAAARVVQPVQHPVVRRAEHQRDQRRVRHGGADAGERSTQRPDRHPVHVLTLNRTIVEGYGLRRSAARSLIARHRISSTVRLSLSPSHSEQKRCPPPRRAVDSAR